jgi:hypothetical protein
MFICFLVVRIRLGLMWKNVVYFLLFFLARKRKIAKENLKEVFFSFVKFLDKSGAVFPEELQQIMKEFEQ